MQLDGNSRKTKPCLHARFTPESSTSWNIADDDTLDETTWNGFLLVYRPPMDYAGTEYLNTGYDPSLTNPTGANTMITIKVKYAFYGKVPNIVSDLDYTTARSYDFVNKSNKTQFSFA